MEKYGLNQLREMFLRFFESKGHLRLPSFSLVPQNDASLLLINSGMAPMKPWFTGEQEPPGKRVCTCQKCVRTGDIENIGKTARHGTYFEMLGNFSFGDYFKKEAIAWTWEFLTETVGLPADRLYPSIYLDDEEAFEIWNRDIGIAPERIFRFGKEDNFWEHGSGPCGPCSEVYFDRGPQYGCGAENCTVGCDCDRYIEIWNNVFSQFESDGAGNYTELKQKNIDTGMGLERLACVCQEVPSLFDVDTVMNITNKVSELTGASYGQSAKADVSLRVITDHIRSATMIICDGVLPSNEGRGYVLRRLLRRAARHGKLLGVNEAFLCEICDVVIGESSGAYPELAEKREYITRVIKTEEDNFARTIDAGIKILEELIKEHKTRGDKVFSGADAFKLYDTCGFPIDLTLEMLEEQGMTADIDAFGRLMQEQRERARAARADLGNLAWAGIDLGIDAAPTEFTGYETLADVGKILAIVADGELRSAIRSGEEGVIVLDKTPFYAEMGGQAADFGFIKLKNARFEVTGVQKNAGGKFLHHGKMVLGELSVDDKVSASVDAERRRAIMRAHSATHLLHTALRIVLGDQAAQAGSLVEPDRLRFDFTHFAAVTSEELLKIEALVNNSVLEGYVVRSAEMAIEEARKTGATALFGEKYGDVVRVVDMSGYSVELCGGTHLDNTAKVGPFRIESEFSVASGVRRIEAVTGQEALRKMTGDRELIVGVSERLKAKPSELLSRAEQQMTELRDLRHQLSDLRSRELLGSVENLMLSAKTAGDLRVLTAVMPDGTDADALRRAGDFMRDKAPDVIAVLAAVSDGKITFLASCGKDAVSKGLRAGDIIRHVSAICGGSGGGKPDSAMGGGKNVSKLDDALASVYDFAAEKLGLEV